MTIRAAAALTMAAVIAVALLCPARAQEVPRYSVVDLGTLPGGWFSGALAINDRGDAVGVSNNGERRYHAVLWAEGTIRDLGTYGAGVFSQALWINDAGDVVGQADVNEAGDIHAVLWSGDSITDLGTLPGATFSSAFGINSIGQVVGVSTASGRQRGFRWSNGEMEDLGILPGGSFSRAFGINAAGRITGGASTGRTVHAVSWRDGIVEDLGTLPGGMLSNAFGVNEFGDVAGVATIELRTFRAVRWQGGVMQDLGTLPGHHFSQAFGINRWGDVVGFGFSDQELHGFLYADGQMHDLNALVPADSGWVLLGATAINDARQVVGTGRVRGGFHAFRLDPVASGSEATVAVQRTGRTSLALDGMLSNFRTRLADSPASGQLRPARRRTNPLDLAFPLAIRPRLPGHLRRQ